MGTVISRMLLRAHAHKTQAEKEIEKEKERSKNKMKKKKRERDPIFAFGIPVLLSFFVAIYAYAGFFSMGIQSPELWIVSLVVALIALCLYRAIYLRSK
jgi:cation transport ATPase